MKNKKFLMFLMVSLLLVSLFVGAASADGVVDADTAAPASSFTVDVDGEVVEHNEDYLELDTESAVIGMEYGSALVWFDDDLDISKMMFYGATVLEE